MRKRRPWSWGELAESAAIGAGVGITLDVGLGGATLGAGVALGTASGVIHYASIWVIDYWRGDSDDDG